MVRLMPSGEEVQQYLTGVWQMMLGRSEGLSLLDLSVDGFWNSFYAIMVALPALVVGWVAIANSVSYAVYFEVRFAILLRLFIVDMGAWVLPLAVLGAISRPAGIASRFVHYVVASNWASALFAWLMLPSALLRLFWPGAQELTLFVSIVLFIASLVLSWRLTIIAIGRGLATGSAVFLGMLVTSITALMLLQELLGLDFQ
ncbi:transporter [Chelativorans sp. Marseille-P2723]|uniref:transporter n=1 Tax=Chelativorans sp. Marseille-P2723 TaxID=2709133 RepID=UPI001FEE4BBA|nr:transporter [Chelativorans sp. Marseille-P2723]